MRRALVTGGCGFIGSHIVEELVEKGYEVFVVDNLSTGYLKNIVHLKDRVQYKYLDILSDEFGELFKDFKPDYVLHQAAQVSVAKSINNITEDARINIEGSVRVIEESIKSGVKKLVFASSAAVYGNVHYTPVDINHPLGPISPYGLSKQTVENYLQLSNRLYGLHYSILRYSNVYGPRQDSTGEGGVVCIFVNKMICNKPILIHGDGTQTRDFVHVKDVARANVACLEIEKSGIYNVSSMKKTSINELYQLIRSILGVNVNPHYSEQRFGDIKDSLLCNLDIYKELGWAPEVNLLQGLKMTILSEKTELEKTITT